MGPNPLDEALGLTEGALAGGVISGDAFDGGVLSGGAFSRGRVVLIEDCVETRGAFVIHHLLKRALSHVRGGEVLFLALAHPFSHYDRIMRKMGCNLSMHREQGRFHLFDMLKFEISGATDKSTVEGAFIELYSKILMVTRESSSRGKERGHLTLAIDDLSMLEIAAYGSSDLVLNFLHYCITLTSEQDCSLVILNHEDIYEDKGDPSLISYLIYMADFVIKAEPLVTGMAADVHGQLTVVKKGSLPHNHCPNRASCFHFRVKENGLELFLPGTRC